MKNALIPAALLLSLIGTAQAETTVYGLIDASYGKSVDDDVANRKADFHSGGDNGNGEGNSTTRVGLKGSYDVGSGMKANFKFETNGIQSDGHIAAPFLNRAAWFGISGGFGELRLGRQDSIPFQTLVGFDVNGASNGLSSQQWSGMGQWILRGRQSRSLQYISPTMGGVKVQVGFVPEGNVAGDKATASGALSYAAGPLAAAATFESKRTDTGSNYAAIAGSYDFGVLKIAAGYGDGGTDKKGLTLGVVAPVAGFNIGAQYAKNTDTKGSACELFVNKEFLKNTYGYAEIGRADKDSILGAAGTGFAVGVIYAF